MYTLLLLVALGYGQTPGNTNIAWSSTTAVEEPKPAPVPTLQYAIRLRDELRRMHRLCDHAEDWDATVRAVAEGAQLVEMAVCHHDKRTLRTTYRVVARWLSIKVYPNASVVEGAERRAP